MSDADEAEKAAGICSLPVLGDGMPAEAGAGWATIGGFETADGGGGGATCFGMGRASGAGAGDAGGGGMLYGGTESDGRGSGFVRWHVRVTSSEDTWPAADARPRAGGEVALGSVTSVGAASRAPDANPLMGVPASVDSPGACPPFLSITALYLSIVALLPNARCSVSVRLFSKSASVSQSSSLIVNRDTSMGCDPGQKAEARRPHQAPRRLFHSTKFRVWCEACCLLFFITSTRSSMQDASSTSSPLADLTAGWCVGMGAVHAGQLAKRSEWLHAFNPRFFIVTVEESALPIFRQFSQSSP